MDTKKVESDWIRKDEPVSEEEEDGSEMSFDSDSSKEWTVDTTLTRSKVDAVPGKTVGQTRFLKAIQSIEKRAMEQEERKKKKKEKEEEEKKKEEKKEKKEKKGSASVKPTSGR